jgi:ribosome biogenesis GTPase A
MANAPLIQWYPGHIAKAEKALKEQLKRVDVVLEVRDARIPITAHHPQLTAWIGDKPCLLVLNRLDMIPDVVQRAWGNWFTARGQVPYFTDAQHGQGIKQLLSAAQAAGQAMNQRRQSRGMLPRPVRAVVIGFPNVGKSALINRLIGRRVVESARKAGVTRQLRWVRITEAIELLDAPGVIPAKLEDQEAATKLAICDDIGEAAYDAYLVAVALVNLIRKFNYQQGLCDRYGLSPDLGTAEEYLVAVAEHRYHSNLDRTAKQLLNDFRIGALGKIALELPNAVV